MAEEKIVKLLEEIRDLHKANSTKYDDYLKKSDERYENYLAKVKKMLMWFMGLILVLLLLMGITL